MSVNIQTKSIVSVSEMAKMCSLSRARFYQLVNQGIFPTPLYRLDNQRPFFNEDLQEVCLEVRRRNCGINGKPVMFYSRNHDVKPKRTPVKKTNKHADLIDGLKGLGLKIVKSNQVEDALKICFPNGCKEVDEGTVLRTLFLHISRQY